MTEANLIVEDVKSNTDGKTLKIVHVSGQLDESNIDEKIKAVYQALESNPKGLNLIFDLENLEYMNSKSIGYITDIYGKLTETGGQLVIAGAKSNILDILQVVGLTQLLKTYDTVKEALSTLGVTATTEAVATPPAAGPQPESTETYKI